jgi:uncharacterized 2Fe-2S/4Fe-4S cluster protein (DUF4445 family)
MRIEIGTSIFEVDASDATLAELMRRLGISLDLPCSGRGSCGKCKTRVFGHLSELTDAERSHLSKEEIESGFRLACQVRPLGDCSVRSYPSAGAASLNILVDGAGPDSGSPDLTAGALVTKHVVHVPEPSMQDQRYYFDRVLDSLEAEAGVIVGNRVHASRGLLLSLPRSLRECKGEVTVALTRDRIISVEPGDTALQHYGVAFDVGTTTVVGYLVDLRTGAQLAAASCTNPQVAHGADLVSRITFAAGSEESREVLRSEILSALNELIQELVSSAGISRDNIYHAVVAGNTCMTHMLLGLETSALATMPYVGLIGRSYHDEAARVGVELRPGALVSVLPNIGGFVGSDTVAAVVAAELDMRGDTSLLLDLGTNGELVLSRDGRLLACSTAAGPAFEGAHIVQGMRGTRGAVESVAIDGGDVKLGVIGGGKPIGICGSGLVQAVSELLRIGVIDLTGRLRDRSELEGSIGSRLARRVVADGGERRFVLFSDSETEVCLYQSDIRELQLAKGAVSAGFSVLCKRMGIACSDIDTVLLAGAFGNYVDKASAVRIGMLPGVDEGKIVSLGNAAGTGARMALASEAMLSRAEQLARQITYIELGNDPGFQDEFMNAMMFPDRGVSRAD